MLLIIYFFIVIENKFLLCCVIALSWVTLCGLLAQVTVLIIGAMLTRRRAIGSWRQGFVGARWIVCEVYIV